MKPGFRGAGVQALLSLVFVAGCVHHHRPWVGERDGCVSPPPFETKSATCICRSVEHHRTWDTIEFRCGDDSITWTEHHPVLPCERCDLDPLP